MKKTIKLGLFFLIAASLIFVSCSKKKDDSKKDEAEALKVGMVTDAGTIDDKSFNQGTWEGILKAEEDMNITSKYLKPTGTTEADYFKEIENLYDSGYKFIVTPGYKFESTIYQAQDELKDAYFVLIDGEPHTADYSTFAIGPKTVSIFFAEHESGFLAGLAASLQLKTGEMGFIGGMEIPAVQKFNWGFQQGVAYANKEYGTSITMKSENVVYQGSFDNAAAGQQLAAGMFDKGVNAIFCAAGGVGLGAITEAKTRAQGGETVWIIGVDGDQYNEGIYADGKSIILTSAMKGVDAASYSMIKAMLDGKFPGGEKLIMDASNNGVGIPAENPNLDDSVEKTVAEVYKKIVAGSVKVADAQGDLIK